MLPDDDDKVRRNLVVASAAVILLTFLELSFNDLAAFTSKSQIAWRVEEWRVWASVLFVLFYLGLRLRFSEKSQALAAALHGEYLGLLPEGAKNLAIRVLKKAEKNAASTMRLGFDIGPLLETHRLRVKASEAAFPILSDGIRPPYGPFVLRPQFLELGPFGGRMEVKVSSYLPAPNVAEESNSSLEEFGLNKKDRTMNVLSALFFSYVYSKQATTLLIPALLAATAAGIASFRLVAACFAG
jgi:hypothetical protein